MAKMSLTAVQLKTNERGAIAVTVAIMLTVFLGFTALVVDVGYLYETRRHLQSAADAGALAGCQELVVEASNPAVVTLSKAMANEYAINKNGAAEATPTVNLADQSVTVVAGRTVNLFFANIFGISSGRVQAIAKAEVAYLVGVKELDPMGVPNPKPKEVWVEVVSQPAGTTVYKNKLSGGAFVDDSYEYNGSVPALANGKYRVDIIRVNNQGLEEPLRGATALVVGPNSTLGEVKANPNFINSNTSTNVKISANVSGTPTTVIAIWPKPNGNGENTLVLVHRGSGLYDVSTNIDLEAPTDIGYKSYPITIKVDGVELPTSGAGAYMVIRDPSIETIDTDLGVNYQATGSPVTINTKVQGFKYEKEYVLFLDNGQNYSGNYYGLDLDYREKAPGTGKPYQPTQGHGNANGADGWRKGLAAEYHADPWAPDHDYHYYKVGDYIWTETGGMVGPLGQGITSRLAGDTCTWTSWKNNSSPTTVNHSNKHQCMHLMTVPLVEETTYSSVNGRSKVRIIGFARFFVAAAPNGTALTGRFVEYVKGGYYQKTPPPEPNIKTIHLVKPDGENP